MTEPLNVDGNSALHTPLADDHRNHNNNNNKIHQHIEDKEDEEEDEEEDDNTSHTSHTQVLPSNITYSFVVGFGVPRAAAKDFDADSLSRRLVVFLRCLDLVLRSNNNTDHPISAELLIIQWAPRANHSLLNLIDWQSLALPSLAFVRVIEVPEEQASLAPPCLSSLHPRTLAKPGPTCFEFVAKNVGARRTQGKFLVLFNIDDILTPQLGSLFGQYPYFWKENVFYRAVRTNLKQYLPADHPSTEELYQMALDQLAWKSDERPNTLNGPILAKSLFQIFDLSDFFAGDFLLMSREDFFKVGGYPELGSLLVAAKTYLSCVCVCVFS